MSDEARNATIIASLAYRTLNGSQSKLSGCKTIDNDVLRKKGGGVVDVSMKQLFAASLGSNSSGWSNHSMQESTTTISTSITILPGTVIQIIFSFCDQRTSSKLSRSYNPWSIICARQTTSSSRTVIRSSLTPISRSVNSKITTMTIINYNKKTYIATGDEKGELSVRDMATLDTQLKVSVHCMNAVIDINHLVRHREVWLVARTGRRVCLYSLKKPSGFCLKKSKDSQTLTLTLLKVIDESEKISRSLLAGFGDYYFMALSTATQPTPPSFSIYDLRKEKLPINTPQHDCAITDSSMSLSVLKPSLNGRFIHAATRDGHISSWDSITGTQHKKFRRNTAPIIDLLVGFDVVVASHGDRYISVECDDTWMSSYKHDEHIESISFINDENHVVVNGVSGLLILLSTRDCSHRTIKNYNSPVSVIQSYGDSLLVTSQDCLLCLWSIDFSTETPCRDTMISLNLLKSCIRSSCIDVVVDEDSKKFKKVIIAGKDKLLSVCDI